MALPDLVTLTQAKAFLGITDTASDAKLALAISGASAAIRSYTGRAFGQAAAIATNTYAYDRSGWLDIDDCTLITAVTLDSTALVLNQTYTAGPDRGYLTPDGGSVYEWLEVVPGYAMSPAMGFTYNLDTFQLYGLVGLAQQYSSVAVTATFGYPSVPPDVVQAALITTGTLAATSTDPYQHVAISSYAVTKDGTASNKAIASQALDLLAPYRRFV